MKGVPETLAEVRGLLTRVDRLVAAEQDELRIILANFRRVSENLIEFSENAKRYPSQVLFGEPPERKEPIR